MIPSQNLHSLAFECSDFGLALESELSRTEAEPASDQLVSPPRAHVLGTTDVANVPVKTKKPKLPDAPKTPAPARAPYYTLVRLCLSTHEVFATISSWHSVYGSALKKVAAGPSAHFQRKRYDMWHVTLCGESQLILHLLLRSRLQYVSVVFGDFDVRSRPHNPQPPSKQNGGLVRVGLLGIRTMTDLIGEIHRVSRAGQRGVSESQHGEQGDEKENTAATATAKTSVAKTGAAAKGDFDHRAERAVRCDSLRFSRRDLRSTRTFVRDVFDTNPFEQAKPASQGSASAPSLGATAQFSLSVPSIQALANGAGYSRASSSSPVRGIGCETNTVAETVKLSKKEVTAVIGPGGSRISFIRNKTNCHIAILPVFLETIYSRCHVRDVPQTISLSGTAQQVAHAKVMLRRVLIDFRAGQKKKS